MSEPAKNKRPPDNTWVPVIWSVVVFPGIGQWLQQRRNAGTFYCAVFSLLALVFTRIMYLYLSEVVPLMRDALMGEPLHDRTFPPLKNIIMPFGAVLFVYLANVVDVLKGRLQLQKKSPD